MKATDAVIAIFADHPAAEEAVRKLAASGFDIKTLSVVGKSVHSEEKVVGFYNIGDRVKFWGVRGAFWGGLWGLFFGGLLLTVPVIGHVVVLGYLAAAAISVVESAALVGGMSALGAAIYSLGIPKDSVIEYEAAIKSDGFLVMVHGSSADMARAKEILQGSSPTRVDLHTDIATGHISEWRHHAGDGTAPLPELTLA